MLARVVAWQDLFGLSGLAGGITSPRGATSGGRFIAMIAGSPAFLQTSGGDGFTVSRAAARLCAHGQPLPFDAGIVGETTRAGVAQLLEVTM